VAGTNEEKGRTGGRKRTVIAMGIFCGALLAAGFLGRARILDWLRLAEDVEEADAQQKEAGAKAMPRADAAEKNTEESRPGQGSDNIQANEPKDPKAPLDPAEGPRSDFFRRIAEIIWEKKPEDISPEEYASLTSIQIDRAGGLVSYQLNHGYVSSFACPEDLEPDFSDLAFFRGLEWVFVDGSLGSDDLRGLENLSGIHSRNTVNEFTDIIPYPERITELGIEGDASIRNLEGIESFPNLKYLSVCCEGLDDISVLKRLPGLQGLILEGCRGLRDYGPLLSLGELELLKIGACGLESIDFVEKMPKLMSLSLEDVEIADWAEGLFGIPTLRYLYLNGCRLGLDFDRMPENEKLEVLSLNGIVLLEDPADRDSGRVSLSEHCDIFDGFPNLRELYLISMDLEDIGFVEQLPHLQYLDITGNPVRNLEPAENLKELRGIGYGEERKWDDIFIM